MQMLEKCGSRRNEPVQPQLRTGRKSKRLTEVNGGDADHLIVSPHRQGSLGESQWTEIPKILHRKNMRAESDKMTTNGRIEDLVRQFMILPKETRREYSIAVGEREYTFREIENLAREFGIEEN